MKFFRYAILGLFLFSEAALSQLTTGTILGTVKDQTDAVLPGATVAVTNIDTGVKRSATTGTRGEYRIPALGVGTYRVQASVTGFQTSVRSGIALSVGREAVVDFSLKLGDVAEQVTVTSEAPVIETTTATVSGLVDPKQMRDIPLNARSFLELVPLQAGAVFAEAGSSSATKGFGRKLSIVGTRYASNLFLLDGADINDAAGVAGSAAKTMAGVETVREFRVVTNAYDAEYGRHTGGVISAITKSGTNDFHGSVFEFLRNDNLDARNFFDRAHPPEFKRNQFGTAVGGPIIKDRTFFFGSFEGLREGLGLTKTFNVPGIAMRSGVLQGQFVGVVSAIRPIYPASLLFPGWRDGVAELPILKCTSRIHINSKRISSGQEVGTPLSSADKQKDSSLISAPTFIRPDNMNSGVCEISYERMSTPPGSSNRVPTIFAGGGKVSLGSTFRMT